MSEPSYQSGVVPQKEFLISGSKRRPIADLTSCIPNSQTNIQS